MANEVNGAERLTMFPPTELLSGEDQAAICPVEMGGRPDGRCGRPLHAAPAGVDARPVCLMHSRDEGKAAAPLTNAFIEELRAILTAAGQGDAHFDGFVFSGLGTSGVVFPSNCVFDGAVFVGKVDFYESTFEQKVSFAGAQFESKALLWLVQFKGEADFRRAKFGDALVAQGAVFAKGADFSGVVFGGETVFSQAQFDGAAQFEAARFEGDGYFSAAAFAEARFPKVSFLGNALFDASEFRGEADFTEATFAQEANFQLASFAGPAHFGAVNFGGRAVFSNASFLGATYLRGVTFNGVADFSKTKFADVMEFSRGEFKDVAIFSGATFKGPLHSALVRYAEKVTFTEATFEGIASWASATFVKGAEFRGVRFEPAGNGASAVFALVAFAAPEEVVFHDVDLSRVLFHNCDVSEVRFTSSVRWGARGNGQGALIYEETIGLDHEAARGLRRNGMRDYGAVAQIYQQLKKNYDGRLDYWTANEFHFGEMEMRRLDVPSQGPLLELRQWWKPRLGMVALYKYASSYGNSYWRPVWVLALVLVVFALLFPLAGMERKLADGRVVRETYWTAWTNSTGTWSRTGVVPVVELVGDGLLTAVDTAAFQKGLEYTPAYPWGRVLAIVETLLTSTLFGLFLLAIRRQFRR